MAIVNGNTYVETGVIGDAAVVIRTTQPAFARTMPPGTVTSRKNLHMFVIIAINTNGASSQKLFTTLQKPRLPMRKNGLIHAKVST